MSTEDWLNAIDVSDKLRTVSLIFKEENLLSITIRRNSFLYYLDRNAVF